MDHNIDTRQAFPTKQLLLIGLCRVSEPVALTSVFPYAYDFMGYLMPDDSLNAATYAGLFLAVFSLAETLTGFWWGSLSDKIGRKPVILLGLGGTVISLLLLGFSTNIWVAILARLLGGALNGNTGVVQTMVSETVSRPEHEARAYAIVPFFFSVGCTIGPALGGLFAGPEAAAQLPLISKISLFGRFPFLLPNVVCIILVAFTILLALTSLEETHPLMKRSALKHKSDGQQSDDSARAPLLGGHGINSEDSAETNTNQPSTWAVLLDCLRGEAWKPIVAVCLLTGHTVTYIQLLPIFLRDPRDMTVPKFYFGGVGGLAISLREAGLIMGVNGIIGLVAQLVFPVFTGIVGVERTLFIVSTLHPLAYFSLPYIAFVPNGTWRYVCLYTWLTLRYIFSAFTYPVLLIYVRRWTPNPLILGKVNGLVASAGAGCRTVFPVLAGFLQTIGQKHHFSALGWWSSGVVAIIATIVTWSFETVAEDED